MTNSENLYTQAKKYIPGGVNSPVRSFKGVGGNPIFFQKAKGAYLTSVEGKEYIDYVGSWGPMILGHSYEPVIRAVEEKVQLGLSFGTPTEIEIALAEKICQLVPNVDQIRMVNSGTEATMSAIRLARGYTGRDKIIKFSGCYHGHADSLLVKAGSGGLTLGIPDSKGVPADLAQHTLTADFNHLDQVEQMFAEFDEQIAAIIVEPLACNMNCVSPADDFLQGLRTLCDRYHAVLIFDEVMTGFRLGLAGAQSYYKVNADLITFGKIIGGGLPIGAFGGKKAIMEYLAPLGPVYQAGTLSGNPISMAAGLATLTALEKLNPYANLNYNTQKLTNGLLELANNAGIALHINQVESFFGYFFTEQTNIHSYEDVARCNLNRFRQFYHAMLIEGIYLAPSAFEVGFVSIAHGDEEIAKTLHAAHLAFEQLN